MVGRRRGLLIGTMPTRIIITGDRHWGCFALAEAIIHRLAERYGWDDLVIVHGAATGVDASFGEACSLHDVTQESHPADWSKGKAAGPIRNQEMVDAGADFAIAVHRNLAGSRGTRDCVRRCLSAGIPVWLIDSDEIHPRRITSP